MKKIRMVKKVKTKKQAKKHNLDDIRNQLDNALIKGITGVFDLKEVQRLTKILQSKV